MSSAVEVMGKLDRYAGDLDTLSNDLASTERELSGYILPSGIEVQGVEKEYEDWLDTFETGLWSKHVNDDAKLPSEQMRLRLARMEMPSDLLGRYTTLVAKRKRLEKRIGSLKTQVSAQQSILSALKLEAESSGAGLRSAA